MESESTSTGLPPQEPKKNSKIEICIDCGGVFSSVVFQSTVTGRSYWSGDWRKGRCEPCYEKYTTWSEEANEAHERREQENRRKRQIISLVGGVKPYEHFTLDKFRGPESPEAYAAALRFTPAHDNLFFYGKNHRGKTHLAIAIARKFLERGRLVEIHSVPDLISKLRSFESRNDFYGEEAFIGRLSRLTILVLDDLGLGNATDYVVTVLWKILTNRINNAQNGLIVTSNLSLNDLNVKYGGKIPYRINDLCGEKNLFYFGPKKETAS
jgi:DNA replication protein DnaC